MADGPQGFNAKRMTLVVVLVLAVLAVAAWQLGYFDSGTDEGMRTAYKTDVVDESGGELIVTDPDAPGVEDVTVPETAMTPVPPEQAGDSAPAAAPEAE